MVCDLDVLEAALADVTAVVRDADLEVIRPPEAEAVTVEVFARWVHGAVVEAIRRRASRSSRCGCGSRRSPTAVTRRA